MGLSQHDIDNADAVKRERARRVGGDEVELRVPRKLVKPIIATLVSLLGIAGSYRAAGGDLPIPSIRPVVDADWKARVEAHMTKEDEGLERIGKLENWSCRFELSSLQQNRWSAKQARDYRRVEELDSAIKRLEARRQCE